jgi:hypothetical protein
VRLLLRAREEFAKHGHTPPARLFQLLDPLESSVPDGNDASARDMRRALGRRLSRSQLGMLERRRDIVEMYWFLVAGAGLSPARAKRAVAKHCRTTSNNVARIVSQWGGLTVNERLRHRRRPIAGQPKTSPELWWKAWDIHRPEP